MTAEPEPLASGGWRIAAGFASRLAPRESRCFYAVYPGEAFGHAERGIIAAMARGHSDAAAPVEGARASVQSAVHALAEGYFGAQRTLSPRRALGVSLIAINRWLFGQGVGAPGQRMVPVSVTALVFHGGKLGIAQVGACKIFRARGGELAPLMREHGRGASTHAIGQQLEFLIDYAEEEAEPGDRYIVLSGLESEPHDAALARISPLLGQVPEAAGQLAERLLPALGNAGEADRVAMVLDVMGMPAKGLSEAHAHLADLPLKPAPREGDVWDGFKLGKTLYHGRYTMLKAAYDTIENREVALKIPLPAMLQDEVFAAGFMREAWIGTTVRGAAIARYLELPAQRRSSLYLVMPLYRGETLEARLNRPPPMPLPEGIGIALKLCEAVSDLAAIQIIHRDIKPENIMLLEGGEVKLLDLGLAYLPGIDAADSVKPGGTIRYMAPELLQGTPANARTEVYALAVTIYRMFSGGAFPFGQRERLPLARLRPDLPAWLGEALGKALAPKPSERFAHAGALAAALQLGLTTGAEARSRAYRNWPLTKLQIWQAAAMLFAAGFFFLLLRSLK